MALPVKPFYFLHIPKTAGVSLRNWLRDFFAVSDLLDQLDIEQLENLSVEELARYRLFCGHFGLELYSLRQLPASAFDTITWLRDPLSLQISHYNYFRQDRERLTSYFADDSRSAALIYLEAANKLSLAELAQQYRGWTDNLQVRHLAGNAPRHANGKQECNDEMLEIAQRNLLNMLHFGLCEWMQPSIELLCYRAQWLPRKFDLHLNRTAGSASDIKAKLSEADLAIIYDINQYDYALYGFAKREFKRRYQEMWEACLKAKPASRQLVGQLGGATNFASATSLMPSTDLRQPDAASHECLLNFLENNFRSRSDKREDRTYIKFSEAVFSSGWHEREYNVQLKTWTRWAGPDTTSCIYLPLKAGISYRLSIWLLRCLAPDIIASLTLEVETIPIKTEQFYVKDANGQTQTLLTGVIPGELIRNDATYTKLVFKVNRVVPLKPDEATSKLVSFAIEGVNLEPLTIPSLLDPALAAEAKLQEKQERIWYLEYVYQQAEAQRQTAEAEVQQLQSGLEQTQAEVQQLQANRASLEQTQMQLQTELQQAQAELSQTQTELQQVQTRLGNVKSRRDQLNQELEQTLHQLQAAKDRITAMETSKFWQLRRSWFKLKRLLGAGENE